RPQHSFSQENSMNTKWRRTFVVGLSIGIIGCSTTPGTSDLDGSGGSGNAATGGSTASGGATASGGSNSSGGTASGGASADGSGGAATGGNVGSGGGDAAGGSGSGGETSGGDNTPSAGCNVTDGPDKLTVGGSSVPNGLPTSTKLSIQINGAARDYIVDIPADYDPTHPYRLIFSWHQAYGSSNGNANGQYPANNGPNFD